MGCGASSTRASEYTVDDEGVDLQEQVRQRRREILSSVADHEDVGISMPSTARSRLTRTLSGTSCPPSGLPGFLQAERVPDGERDVVTDSHFDSIIDILDCNPLPTLLLQADGALVRVNDLGHALLCPDGAVLNAGVLIDRYLRFPPERVGNPPDYSQLVSLMPLASASPRALELSLLSERSRHMGCGSDGGSDDDTTDGGTSDVVRHDCLPGRIAEPHSDSSSADDEHVRSDLLALAENLGQRTSHRRSHVPAPLVTTREYLEKDEFYFDAHDGSPCFSTARAASPTPSRMRRRAPTAGSVCDTLSEESSVLLAHPVAPPFGQRDHNKCLVLVRTSVGSMVNMMSTTVRVAIGTKTGYLVVLQAEAPPPQQGSARLARRSAKGTEPGVTTFFPSSFGTGSNARHTHTPAPDLLRPSPTHMPPPLSINGTPPERCTSEGGSDTGSASSLVRSDGSYGASPQGLHPLPHPNSVSGSSSWSFGDVVLVVDKEDGTLADMSRGAQLLTGIDLHPPAGDDAREGPAPVHVDTLVPNPVKNISFSDAAQPLSFQSSRESLGSASTSSGSAGLAPSIFQTIKAEHACMDLEKLQTVRSNLPTLASTVSVPSPRSGGAGRQVKIKTGEKSIVGDKVITLDLNSVLLVGDLYIARFTLPWSGPYRPLGRSRRIAFSFKGGLSEDMACILESGSQAVVACSMSGEIIYCNDNSLALLQYKESDLMREDVSLLVPEPYRSRHAELMRSFYKKINYSLINQPRYTVAVGRNGGVVPISLELRMVQTPHGTEIYLVLFRPATICRGEGGPRLTAMVEECQKDERNSAESVAAYWRTRGHKDVVSKRMPSGGIVRATSTSRANVRPLRGLSRSHSVPRVA